MQRGGDPYALCSDFPHALPLPPSLCPPPQVNNDLNYYYTDPDVTELTRSVYKIENASGGSIVDTVNQFYGDLGSSYAYAMYNDQVS